MRIAFVRRYPDPMCASPANRRFLEPIGNVPPAEFEAVCDQAQASPLAVAGLK